MFLSAEEMCLFFSCSWIVVTALLDSICKGQTPGHIVSILYGHQVSLISHVSELELEKTFFYLFLSSSLFPPLL